MADRFELRLSDTDRLNIARSYVTEAIDNHARYVMDIADGTMHYYPTPGEPGMAKVQQRPCDFIQCSDFVDDELDTIIRERTEAFLQDISRLVARSIAPGSIFEQRKVSDFSRVVGVLED